MKSDCIPPEKVSRLALALLVAASAIPVLAAVSLDPRFPADDALISLCFAKNLAAGHGFVFNHPPPMLGTTTPLFTLTVALFSALGGLDAVVVAFALTITCWLVLIWSFFLFRRAFGLTPRAAAIVGVVIAATGWVGYFSMEAYPFAVVEVLAAALVLSERPFVGGLAGGALFLIRGEGILFAGILGFVVFVSEIRMRKAQTGLSPTLRFVGGAAIPILLWAAYAVPRFSSVLPDTLTAKMAQVSSGLWAPFTERLFAEWLPGWGLGGGPQGLKLCLGWTLVLLGLFSMKRHFPRMSIFPVWFFGYVVGYSLLGVPGYPWYRLPLFLVLGICSALGLDLLFERIMGDERSGWRIILGCVLMLVVLGPTVFHLIQRIKSADIPERNRAYYRLAEWFSQNAEPSETVAYMEVGYLGYYTDLGIVDLVGLVSPEFIPCVVRRDFSTPFWKTEPNYLVELEGSEFIRPILRDPRFSRNYDRVAELKGFDGRYLRVYRRRSASLVGKVSF